MARRKWLPIALGVAIFLLIVGAGLVGTGIYVISRQVEMTTATIDDPDSSFAETRAKFAGQRPYIEFPEGDIESPPIVHREDERDGRPPLGSLHTMIWDSGDRRLVRLTLPFWLVRLGRSGHLRFDSSRSGIRGGVGLPVTAADLERHGPGLIVDVNGRRGERLLVWVE